jgi:hypothetical protein
MAHDTEGAPAEKRGIDRRTLIRRGAAAGAVAWAAPAIIGSLSSPAAGQAAGSPLCGCVIVSASSGSCQTNCENATADCGLGCDPPLVAAKCNTGFSSCVSTANTNCDGSTAIVFTIPTTGPCAQCTFVEGAGRFSPGAAGCQQGLVSAAGKTFTLQPPPAGEGNFNQVQMVVNCNCS